MIFEDIQRVNEGIKTTNIKGKEYAEVNQRIKAFRQLYPEGFIKTEILSNENGVVVMKASVGWYFADGSEIVLATGTAYEKETSSYINKTSYIENCETSAVGRALGMIGFGIDTSVASAEEVENAINNQEQIKDAENAINNQEQIKDAENAINNQEQIKDAEKVEKLKNEKIRELDIKAIKTRYPKKEQQDNILEHFNIKSFKDMTVEMMAELSASISKEEKENAKK